MNASTLSILNVVIVENTGQMVMLSFLLPKTIGLSANTVGKIMTMMTLSKMTHNLSCVFYNFFVVHRSVKENEEFV